MLLVQRSSAAAFRSLAAVKLFACNIFVKASFFAHYFDYISDFRGDEIIVVTTLVERNKHTDCYQYGL